MVLAGRGTGIMDSLGSQSPRSKSNAPNELDPTVSRSACEWCTSDLSHHRVPQLKIEHLDERDPLSAFCQDRFFCRKDAERGDGGEENLMHDPTTKRKTPGGFHLPRTNGSNEKLNIGADTGTIPFAPLDRQSEANFHKPRHYQHEAESLAWSLMYICSCMGKDGEGRIDTVYPHPLWSWFQDMDSCFCSKYNFFPRSSPDPFPLHENAAPIIRELYWYWMKRYTYRKIAGLSPTVVKFYEFKKRDGTKEPYKEPSDRETFGHVIRVIGYATREIPATRRDELRGLLIEFRATWDQFFHKESVQSTTVQFKPPSVAEEECMRTQV